MVLLFKLVLLVLLTFIPSYCVLWLLYLVRFVPSSIGSPSSLLATVTFFIGATALLFGRKPRVWLYSLLAGAMIAAGAILVGLVVVLSFIPIPLVGNAANLLIAVVGIGAALVTCLWDSRTSRSKRVLLPGLVTTSRKTISPLRVPKRPSRAPPPIMGFEVTEIPRDYAFPADAKETRQDVSASFLNIVRHLGSSDVPFSLLFLRKDSVTRVMFLTWAKDSVRLGVQMVLMQDTLLSNLKGFRLTKVKGYEGLCLQEDMACVAVEVSGIPTPITGEEQVTAPMSAPIGVLQGLDNAMVQVFVEPTTVSTREVASLQDRYKKAVQSSETTVTRERSSLLHGDRQESKRVVDPKELAKASRLARELERLNERDLCNTTVMVASCDSTLECADTAARRLASAIMGSVAPGQEQDPFKVRTFHRKKDLDRLLSGFPIGSPTRLTLREVANYLVLPQTDMGIRVTARERFSTSTQTTAKEARPQEERKVFRCDVPTGVRWKGRARSLYYGNPIDENGTVLSGKFLTSGTQYYDGHLLVLGTTRSGKTWSAMSLIGQAISMGLNPVVLVPSKAYEWRTLMRVFPGIRVFTAGDDTVAGFKLNFWEPPPKVPLRKWVDRVVQVLTLWLPNDRVISMHVEDWVYSTYANCGWDIESGERGHPILFEDIVEGVLTFGKELNYDEEVNKNFYGALVARVRSLLRKPSLVGMFNTSEGISIPGLLSHPTIIEMDALSQSDTALLMGMLTAAISEYKLANPSKRVENLLVLEEAHYVLGRNSLDGEANSAARQQAVHAFVEMLRVLGGTGLGLVIIDQLPSALASEVVKLPVNAVLHRLKEDRETMAMLGSHIGCSDAQIQHIRGMERGEAVVYLEEAREPKNVQMIPLSFLFHDQIDTEHLGSDAIRAHMSAFYDANPQLARHEPLPEGLMKRLATRDRTDVPGQGKASIAPTGAYLTNPEFMEAAQRFLDEGSGDALAAFAGLVYDAVGASGLPRTIEVATQVIGTVIPNEHGIISKEVISRLLEFHR